MTAMTTILDIEMEWIFAICFDASHINKNLE